MNELYSGSSPGGIPDHPHSAFPDWSQHTDLEDAARAYLRDPEEAIDSLRGMLVGRAVAGFTLERYVNDQGVVWQEAAVCDGERLVLWHGEDMPPGEGQAGEMTSSLRVVPLSAVTEVGCRRRLVPTASDSDDRRVAGIDMYVLLASLDEAGVAQSDGETSAVIRHDALRFGKTMEDGGPGQVARLEEFARLVAGLVGGASSASRR